MVTTKKSDEKNNKSKDCLKLLLEWEIEMKASENLKESL